MTTRTPAARARRAASIRQGASTKSPRSRPRERGPELDQVYARFEETIKQPVRHVVGFVRFLADRAAEAESPAEALPQRQDVLGRAHRPDAGDAKLLGDGEHRRGLVQCRLGGRHVLGVRLGPRDMGMHVEQRRADIAEVVPVVVVDARDVVFGRGAHGASSPFV
jgi:hypothetical protein